MENSEEKIMELQLLEQNMNNLLLQKQSIQSQLIEVDNALEELGKNPKQTFKIIGGIMVETTKQKLETDLNEKKEILEIKIKNFDKQEDRLKEKVQIMQSQLLEAMKEK